MAAPFISNEVPSRGATNAGKEVLIKFDILDEDSDIDPTTISIYVRGNRAYDGATNTFFAPYDGPDSYFGKTLVDGYDGYHIDIDSYNAFFNLVTVQVDVDDLLATSLSDSWNFKAGAGINSLYFSDGYGVKSVAVEQLVGESQDVVRTLLDEAVTNPNTPYDKISSIFGNEINNDLFLSVCFDGYDDGIDAYGTLIVKNEINLNTYSPTSHTFQAQINDDGTLYQINKDLNQIEVFYGADAYSGYGRSPDYIYNESSTPPVFPGEIIDLHVVSGESLATTGGTRLYIGTSKGFSRIEAHDEEAGDGYSAGNEAFGLEFTYGIVGSGADFEVIGGTVPRVISVSSDDARSMIIVGTNDGYGNGGVSQILLSGNRRILFMDKASGFLPSDDITDVFGKGFPP